MAMNKEDLSEAIIAELQNLDSLPTHLVTMQKFSSAIKNYVETNCEITFSWVATLPPPSPPTPDPVTSYTAEIKFPSFNIVMSPVDTADAAMTVLGLSLTSNLITGIITPKTTVPPFVVPTITFLPVTIILSKSGLNSQTESMLHLSEEIIAGIKKMINPTPLIGTHGPYTVPTPGAIMTLIE